MICSWCILLNRKLLTISLTCSFVYFCILQEPKGQATLATQSGRRILENLAVCTWLPIVTKEEVHHIGRRGGRGDARCWSYSAPDGSTCHSHTVSKWCLRANTKTILSPLIDWPAQWTMTATYLQIHRASACYSVFYTMFDVEGKHFKQECLLHNSLGRGSMVLTVVYRI